MLTKLDLQNYRAHTATEIPLSPLTVLIGPNAVGKSSALEALHLLGRLLEDNPEKALTGPRELRWLHRRGATEGELKTQRRKPHSLVFLRLCAFAPLR